MGFGLVVESDLIQFLEKKRGKLAAIITLVDGQMMVKYFLI